MTAVGFNPGDGLTVLSFTGPFIDPDVPFNVLSFTTLVVQQVGQQPVIVESDTIFNDQFFWTENTTNLQVTPQQWSLYAAALHEGGAILGLGSTYLRAPLLDLNQVFFRPDLSEQLSFAPIMFPWTISSASAPFTGINAIARDDEVGVSELYPSIDYYDQVGTIKGRLFDAQSGKPVFPVHVTAFNANTRQPIVSEVNSKDGSFQVRGLPAGPYFLLFEPAPPLFLFSPYFSVTPVNFIPTFYQGVLRAPTAGIIQIPANAEMKIVQVAAGKTTSGVEQGLILGFTGNDRFEPNDELLLSPEITPTSDPTQGPIAVIQDVDNNLRDLDVYRFFANQGDLVRIRVLARQLGSALDARVRLYSGAALERYAEQNPNQPDPTRMFRDVPPLALEDNDPETGALDPDLTYRVQEGGAFVVVVDRSPLQAVPARTDPRIDYYQLVIEILSGVVPIPPESDPFPVLSLNLSAQELGLNPSNSQLLEITLSIRDYNNDGDITYDPGNPLAVNDFKDPITAQGSLTQSGVALYRNDGPEVGKFDFNIDNPAAGDRPVSLSEIRVIEHSGEEIRVTLVLAGQELLPAEADNTVDYWIALRSSLNLAQGDDFTVSIPAGGIKVRDLVGGQPRDLSVFSSVYPSAEKQNIYSGDIVKFTMPLQPSPDGQRINARSTPTAVLGLNVKGAAGEEYWLHQIDVTLVGTNALLFLRALDYSSVIQNELSGTLLPQLTAGQDTFRLNDLLDLSVSGRGGIGIYRDNDGLDAQGNPVGKDGMFEEDVDLPIELESSENPQLGRSEIPRRLVGALVPPYMDKLHEFGSTLDLVDAQAYVLTLTLRREGQQDRLRIPDTDQASSNSGGADFHVVVRTSGKVSAMDTFLPIVQVGGVRVANGLNVPPVPGEEVVSVRSLSRLDDSSIPQTRSLICRPRPEITVSDLTSETSVLVSEGEDTRLPVFGINANDRGQNAFRIFATGDYVTDRYFNQSYTFDAFTVVITQVLPGQPAREVYPASGTLDEFVDILQYLDRNPVIPAGGMNLYFDDDTPIGDGIDNDGDFLIDEELVNNIDDDMDGAIDEDVGDGDPAGLNGVWDPVDDVHPGGRFFRLSRRINPIIPPAGDPITYTRRHVFSNANYRLHDPLTVTEVNNALRLRVPLLMTVQEEGREFSFSEYWGVINDPLTINFDNVFIRTDFQPIWTGVTAFSSAAEGEIVYNGPGEIKDADTVPLFEMAGYYVDFPDTVNPQTDFPVQTTYSAVVEFPDDDIGATAGPDYFLVASASPSATPEVLIRFEFPSGGVEYSVFQSRWVNFNGAFPGTGGNRVKTGPIRVQGQAIMPTLRIIQPGPGANIATKDQTFNITWRADDPDSIAEIRLYLDTDAIAGNGLIAGSTVTRIELTASPLREGINPEFFIVNLSQVLSDPRYRHLGFSLSDPALRFYVVAEIYDRVVDGQPDPERSVTVYSNGYITPFRLSAAGLVADYIKLHRNGTLSSFGEAPIIFNFQQTANLALDFEITQSGGGALGLMSDGQVRASGNVEGLNGVVFGQGLVDLTRLAGGLRQVADAVDMEVDFGRGGLVILGRSGELAAYGSLYPESFIEALSSQAQARVAALSGVTAVDVELAPGFAGGYVLLSNGEVLRGGTAGGTGSGASSGAPAVDLTLLPAGNGYYILYADGTVTAAGDASTELARLATPLNRADARDLEVTFSSEGPGLLILRGTGQVVAYGSVEIGFDATRSENLRTTVPSGVRFRRSGSPGGPGSAGGALYGLYQRGHWQFHGPRGD
ncbi:carboxypeptidase regulatory-like domain-containing protein [bacterium]|nr:carboxypeptidase regulatory-like domain-containing protein [bacterium]